MTLKLRHHTDSHIGIGPFYTPGYGAHMKLRFLLPALLAVPAFCSAGLLRAAVVKLRSGEMAKVIADTPEIFHIQISRNGIFKTSILERYGLVRRNWRPVRMRQSTAGDLTSFKTSEARLILNSSTGRLRLLDKTGEVIMNRLALSVRSAGAAGLEAYKHHQRWLADYFHYNAHEGADGIGGKIRGQPGRSGKPEKYIERFLTRWSIPHFGVRIGLDKTEQLYGLGEASQKRIALRGFAYRNWVEYRGSNGFDPRFARFEQTEGGIPFVSSTRGWALLMDTAWPTYFDLGAYRKKRAYVWGPYGHTDFYLMAGGSLRRNIKLYTQITGRPILLPEWGYGLWFDGNTLINQFEMLNEAVLFRRYKFPADVYSLEPGWMEKNYDSSHRANWNSVRFFVPPWCTERQTFIGAMRRLGFRMGLWFCCNDDLTLQAEREVARRRGHPNTVPTRPHGWYHHLRKFVKQGVRAFKIDPASIMLEHPGRKYFNGRRDLEMHNLTQSLLAQQMYQGAVKDGPGSPRIFTQYAGFYIGTQHWVANTMDDDSIGPGTLCWMLNLGLTGNMNVTADMDPNEGRAAIQAAFFSGWTDIQSWAYFGEPWLLDPKMQAIFRYYDDLRHRLIPYIYSTAWRGTQTGIPIMRAMPLMYPNDPQCAKLTHEYMFGRDFLNVVYTHRAYLPKGDWIDYWTGRLYHGGHWITLHVPTDRGGGLFVRAGAIVPMWPVVEYVSRTPSRKIGLSIWPSGKSSFTLYQDDGATYQYLKGKFAVTRIVCRSGRHGVKLAIGPTIGVYGKPATPAGAREKSWKDRDHHLVSPRLSPAGALRGGGWGAQPKRLSIALRIHTTMPAGVRLNGHAIAAGAAGWQYKPATGAQSTGVLELVVQLAASGQHAVVVDLRP
jgi:alpha-glucosidase (family GH31 glycosyl hydrolase)